MDTEEDWNIAEGIMTVPQQYRGRRYMEMSERIEITVPENRQAGIWNRIREYFKGKELTYWK